jgi:hypothetical protein
MSKTLSEAQVTTAKARSRLELGVHWRRLDAEAHLGYRKGKQSGIWLVRWRNPLFAKAEIIDITLEPGEALLIPVGWWHHVRSLDISVNISLTNFLFPNDFENCYLSSS